jgi:hypothetical protein
MNTVTKTLAALAIGAALAQGAFAASALADSARAQPLPFFPIENEAAPKLIADAPLAEPLARGVAIIQYRTENFRVLPIFGVDATDVSPRAGHLHVTIDDLPWHWADVSSTSAIVVAGLPAGPHKVLIELASPEHRVYTSQTVTFTVPESTAQAQ